ncbi:unnamed protein product [Clonostachys rosea]|uniref:Uncharacterized protein n=1 Tax=Bionectria ochroleuca TaxID=29856 RepID=A0ABY6TTY7_BIOOC|nr:unnamed protein product [Clonostachys rosea]
MSSEGLRNRIDIRSDGVDLSGGSSGYGLLDLNVNDDFADLAVPHLIAAQLTSGAAQKTFWHLDGIHVQAVASYWMRLDK